MFPVFLSSGLFLGWSLGANDASNVFGTAVGSGMIRFRTAACICALFVTLGAVISGAGAAHTLGKLGAVNALAGAFMVALSAAVTVYAMTVARYPVSTSQAIVGAIVGWNMFSGSLTDATSLTKIMLTWVACPLLAALFAVSLYLPLRSLIQRAGFHIITLDKVTRWGLVLAGAFGSFSLGANNIANVMGVFLSVSPFADITIGEHFVVTSEQQLFFIGALAISAGVFTYSKRVMMTVGSGILSLSPVAAFVVVTAHSLVLFVFSSKELSALVAAQGLPSIPLVPVSSSQAIVGAVVGIGLLKGGRGIRWRTLGGIASSWVTTPVLAAGICFVCLFFLQNVFNQQTFSPVRYELTSLAWERAATVRPGIQEALDDLWLEEFPDAVRFAEALERAVPDLTSAEREQLMGYAEKGRFRVTDLFLLQLNPRLLSEERMAALHTLKGEVFTHRWRLFEVLEERSAAWRSDNDAQTDSVLQEQRRYLRSMLRTWTNRMR